MQQHSNLQSFVEETWLRVELRRRQAWYSYRARQKEGAQADPHELAGSLLCAVLLRTCDVMNCVLRAFGFRRARGPWISVKWGVGYERATKMTERHTLIPHIRASTQRPEHTPIPLRDHTCM